MYAFGYLENIYKGTFYFFSFLGIVDKLGMSYEDSCVATGMGGYLAVPLLRDVYERGKGNLTKQEAHAALQKCMEILYYRDTQSLPKVCILDFVFTNNFYLILLTTD